VAEGGQAELSAAEGRRAAPHVAEAWRMPLLVAACCKLVDIRVDVDPFTGSVSREASSSGMSPADQAALEWALRIAERFGGSVIAVTAGPPAAERVLRDALAVGATRAVRVDLEPRATSAATAAALARVLGSAAVVLCGDASLDRGTGAVPAFLAGELGAEQALGLVGLHLSGGVDTSPRSLRAERRLDHGRREHLSVTPQCVLSVEAHTARLRRAPLAGMLESRRAPIEIAAMGAGEVPAAADSCPPVRTGPYRPRARVVQAPADSLAARERVAVLSGLFAERTPARTLRLPPGEAAIVVLETLKAWGELP